MVPPVRVHEYQRSAAQWAPSPSKPTRKACPLRHQKPCSRSELHGQHLYVIATALFTAMRKGVVGGVLKSDVDLDGGVIRLQRCWDGPATKDGKPLLIPIARRLRPYLEAAIE